MAGGRVLGWDEVQAVVAVAQEAGIPMHLDGARLANAVVASGIAARDWAGPFCSVSLCLSKGLGAPVGSVIAGDREFLERARLWRKRLGGWMRQAGHPGRRRPHRPARRPGAPGGGPCPRAADRRAAAGSARPANRLAAVQSNMVMVGLPNPCPRRRSAARLWPGMACASRRWAPVACAS
ncbi:MAG: beta-eliminating lyase-related protein [Planctomycetota bacterium]